MGLRRYRELLRVPGVAPLLLAAFVARLPYGVFSLALILLLRAAGFDYAEVGIVAAASGLSAGVAAPLYGPAHRPRRADARARSRPRCSPRVADIGLVVAALAGAAPCRSSLLAVAGGATSRPSPPRCARCCPASSAASGSTRRSRSTRSSSSSCSSAGRCWPPAIATLLSPAVAVLTAVALQTAGALGVAASPSSRRWRPAPRAPGTASGRPRRARACARSWPALALTAVAFGVLEIGIPAFAEEHGTRGDAGWLFALWALGSLAGGLWYGARQWRSGRRRFLFVSAFMAVGLAPLPLAGSLPVFAVLLVVAGLGLAPSTAACYSLVGDLAPEGAVTEAYAWQIVAYVGGTAVGAWLAGVVIDAVGVATALACAPAAATLGLLVALAGRRSLMPREASAAPA